MCHDGKVVETPAMDVLQLVPVHVIPRQCRLNCFSTPLFEHFESKNGVVVRHLDADT